MRCCLYTISISAAVKPLGDTDTDTFVCSAESEVRADAANKLLATIRQMDDKQGKPQWMSKSHEQVRVRVTVTVSWQKAGRKHWGSAGGQASAMPCMLNSHTFIPLHV